MYTPTNPWGLGWQASQCSRPIFNNEARRKLVASEVDTPYSSQQADKAPGPNMHLYTSVVLSYDLPYQLRPKALYI